jgi:hypothetical protein
LIGQVTGIDRLGGSKTPLDEQIKQQTPFSVIIICILAIATWALWGIYGGWQIIVVDLAILSGIVGLEEQLNRWRKKSLFVRREFNEPEPVYQPPPKAEPPPRTVCRTDRVPPDCGRIFTAFVPYRFKGTPASRSH